MSINSKIEEIENNVDDYIGRQLIFNYPRNIMVLNLVRYLELIMFFDKGRMSYEEYFNNGHHKISFNLRGIERSIDWAYKYCSPFDDFNFKFNKKYLKDLKLIFDLSRKYSNISDIFYYIRKGTLEAKLDTADKKIILTQKNQKLQLFKIINYYIATHHVEKIFDNEISAAKLKDTNQELLNVINKIKINGNENFFTFNFDIPEIKPLYNKLFETNKLLLWDIDETWSLGTYNVKDFRIIFTSILTISLIHNYILFSIYIKNKKNIEDKFFQNLAPFFSRKKWISQIKNLTGLPSDKIGDIVDDLTYDSKNQQNKNKIGVTTYCFYPIGDSVLTLSNTIVRNSNIERNIWLMLERKNKSLHSMLSNKKESYWRDCLILKLSKLGIWSFDKAIKIDNTDIDLLIIDFKSNFGIAIELKWLTPPNRIADYSSLIDIELKKGKEQALACEIWISKNKELLAKKIGIEYCKIESIVFKSIVLSKNSVGSNVVNGGGAPVISEDLFWWILDTPLNKDVVDLYKIACNKNFYPKITQHFMAHNRQVEYAGYTFLEKGCYVPNNKWNPKLDIK